MANDAFLRIAALSGYFFACPFPQIPMHVVQAPRIRFLRAHRRIVAGRIAGEPGVFAQPGRIVAEGVLGRRSRTGRVVPFRVGGQTNELVFRDQTGAPEERRRGLTEITGLRQRNHLDRISLPFPAAGIIAHYGLPQVLRNFVLGDGVRL